jgi:murein L,D-transpeptidase YafK
MRPLSTVSAWHAALLLAACLLGSEACAASGYAKHEAPIPAATLALMAAKNTTASSPILIRTFKKEAELEIWKQGRDGRFVHLKTFPICRWSGQLGPKLRTGDRQAPEGFYTVAPKQMNPNSSYYLSFDIGFPNAYDRARGATGSYLMVHGTCSSAGCFAMTDKAVGEIYSIAREAFAGGQGAFQFQSFPFRMTAEAMARHRSDPHIAFWRQLKEGSDRFEATGEEPVVGVSAGRYVFAPSKDPSKEALAGARRSEEEARVASLVADGAGAVRTTYSDGGQHLSFTALLRKGAHLGEVSRPEALAFAGREIVVIPARPKRPACPGASGCPTQVADATGTASPAIPADADLFSGTEPWLLTPTPIGDAPTGLTLARATDAARLVPVFLADTSFRVGAAP